MTGPADRAEMLDRMAGAVSMLDDDLSDWPPGELRQLHAMAMDVAQRTNRALAEHEEPRL